MTASERVQPLPSFKIGDPEQESLHESEIAKLEQAITGKKGDASDESVEIPSATPAPVEIDFLRDLEAELSSGDLKDFILFHFKLSRLTMKDLEAMVQEGAALNKFFNLRRSTIQIIALVLELPLDKDIDHRIYSLSKTARTFTLNLHQSTSRQIIESEQEHPPESLLSMRVLSHYLRKRTWLSIRMSLPIGRAP